MYTCQVLLLFDRLCIYVLTHTHTVYIQYTRCYFSIKVFSRSLPIGQKQRLLCIHLCTHTEGNITHHNYHMHVRCARVTIGFHYITITSGRNCFLKLMLQFKGPIYMVQRTKKKTYRSTYFNETQCRITTYSNANPTRVSLHCSAVQLTVYCV